MGSETIDSFSGEYRFLSNFYNIPNNTIVYNGYAFGTVEAAYQAAKSDKYHIINSFCDLKAKEAKKLGKKIDLRADWDEVKLDVMYSLLNQKFSHHVLALKLFETGDKELIEGNDWGDTFWGVCDGVGENHLGKALTNIRRNLFLFYKGV